MKQQRNRRGQADYSRKTSMAKSRSRVYFLECIEWGLMMKFFQIIRMVLWSFLGIRKRSGHDVDLKSAVHPVQVIVTAIVLVAIFIRILLFVVTMAVHP